MTKRKTQPATRLHRKLKLQPHHHSWRKLPHGQTSYPGLMVLLMILGLFLALNTWSAKAATVTSSGSIQVAAVVPGPPPATAPVIDSPTTSQIFTTTPITVTGDCIANLTIKLTRNGMFSGSAPCNGSGRFTLQTDLFLGDNELIAKNYDNLDQAGPASNTVVVTYQPPAPAPAPAPSVAPNQSSTSPSIVIGNPVPPTQPSDQILLQTDYQFRGIKPASKFIWDLKISGGMSPYALSVDWGDGTQMVKTVPNPSTVRLEHTYTRAGTFVIQIRASDAAGRVSYLQLVAVVDGTVQTALGTVDGGTSEGQTLVKLLALMPYYWAATGLVAAFWLGSHASTSGSIFGLRWLRAIRKP